MNEAATAVAAVAILTLVGVLPALVLVARPLEALLLSPVTGALTITPGAVLAVATAGPTIPWVVGSVVVGNALGWWARDRVPRWQPAGSIWPVLATVGVTVAVVAAHVSREPVDWDAHSIWLFHSSWYAEGGTAARDAFRLEAWSHGEYPPLLTAPAGALSRVVAGEVHWRASQLVIAAIGWSSFATAAAVLLDGARRRWASAAGMLAVGGVAIASLGFAVANAEADLAAATTLLLAAACLLVRRDPSLVPLGIAATVAAALCKGESMVAAFALVVLAVVGRRGASKVVWLLPVVAGIGWTVVARLLGAESYLTRDFGGLSASRIGDRAWPSLQRLLEEMGTVALAALLASAGCALLVRSTLRPLVLLWLLVVADVVGLVAVYLVGNIDLQEWLDSSARRVATGPRLLAAMAAVVAVDRCVDVLVSRRPEGAAPAS